jgi:signal transduction histidine kinase
MNDTRINILLIEDNPGDARLIERMLAQAQGLVFESVWVDNLTDGIAHLQTQAMDVLLLDLGLPESTGLDTLQRVLAHAPAALTLLVLSGVSDENIAVQAVQSGAQDYLVKGQVEATLLVRSIRYAMERSQAKQALQQAYDEMEWRVAERTAELARTQDLLRQLAARSEVLQEEERKHLAREIHDELGQSLSVLRLKLSILGLRFGESCPLLEEEVPSMIELVDSTIKVARNVVTSLRPTALDMGIVSALDWLVNEFTLHTGIQCKLHVPVENFHLDERRATEIFRIAQESLTNVRRHAQASKVTVTLRRWQGNYVLEVRDNGKGFNPSLREKNSFGLIGIRERALVLEGKVNIRSIPNQGTSIRLYFPIYNLAG